MRHDAISRICSFRLKCGLRVAGPSVYGWLTEPAPQSIMHGAAVASID